MNFSLLPSLPLFLLLFTAVKGVDPQQCGGPGTTTQLTFFGSTLTNNTLHLPGGMLRYQSESSRGGMRNVVQTLALR